MQGVAHEPTDQSRRTAETMVAAGIPQEEIARCLGISVDTLAKHYRDELDNGVARANAKIAGTLFAAASSAVRYALDGDGNPILDKAGQPILAGIDKAGVTAAMFWLKTRAKWKETSETQLTGKDGAPLAVYTGIVREAQKP